MIERIQKHRTLLTIGTITIVAALVFLRVSKNGSETSTYQLSTGPIEQTVTASGHVSAAGKLDVYTTIDGVITEMYVQNGQTIEADTPLFKVTSTASVQEKEAAKTAYLAAIDAYNKAEQNKLLYQAQLEQAREAVLGKADGLDDYLSQTSDQDDTERDIAYSQDWSARKLFENAEKKFVDAEQTLAATSQSITSTKAAYNATLDQTITNAVPGTVANINPKVGDEVSTPSVSSPNAKPVLTLSNFDTYTVDVNISENDIYRIELGQPATITIESFPDREFTGIVSRVDSIGTVDNGLVTYTISVELNESDIRMRAGMTSDVRIMTAARDNVLLVPNEALSHDSEGNKVVYIHSPAGFTTQVVETGLKNDSHSEVLSGLNGSEILLDPTEVESAE